jgi:protein gp37
MANEMITLTVAERSLETAKTMPEMVEVCGWYEGLRKAALVMGSRDTQIKAADFAIRAYRKLGQMMISASAAGLVRGGRPKKNPSRRTGFTLASAGVKDGGRMAHTARQLGRLDDEQFNERFKAWRREMRLDGQRVTTVLPALVVRDHDAAAAKVRANNISLKQWDEMHPDEQLTLLNYPHTDEGPHLNKQDSAGIEWAQFSWNPIVGCRHDCPYCYARDIALLYPEAFPHGFEPAFRPYMLNAPRNTPVPKEAMFDARFKNVFTGSMCDIFGRWVPAKWIEAILGIVHDNPQFNFLFLTKFPKRMSEFEIPKNAWMGTTVDLQARVDNAEKAFAKLNKEAGIRWLSCEPLLEPLKFKNLDRFNWIVIGGAAKSSKTPAFHPPFPWIADLYWQAKAAKCAVYMKTNLGVANRVLELPFDAPMKIGSTSAPPVFDYLGKAVGVTS